MNSEEYSVENHRSIRLIDIIELGKSYFFHTLKYWWIPLIFALIGGGYYFYKSKITPATFTAKLSFVLVENPNVGGGGFASILSQFGMANGKKGANMDRIIDLLTSREIIGRALFTKTEFQEKTDYLANHYIYIFKLHDQWKKGPNEALYDFYFDNDSTAGFSYLENSVFKSLKSRITKTHLTHTITDGDMFLIKVTSPSEYMSYELTHILFNVLNEYYVEKTIEKHKETFTIVKSRTDSLKRVLLSAETSLARFQDSNRSIFKNESMLKEDRMIREVGLAGGLYLESARNLESARMSLLSSKPIIQPVDTPIYPLTAKYQKPLASGINGGIIGGIFGVFILLAFKFVRDLLEREKNEQTSEEQLA